MAAAPIFSKCEHLYWMLASESRMLEQIQAEGRRGVRSGRMLNELHLYPDSGVAGMRSQRWELVVLLVVALAVACSFVWMIHAHRHNLLAVPPISDLARTNPLNQPGGDEAPAQAYEIYSALYQVPVNEPLAIAENSYADIPQVGTSCLRPTSPDEHEMADAFAAANRQNHRWQRKFSISQEYLLLSPAAVSQAQNCIVAGSRAGGICEKYRNLKHVRLLGVPGWNTAHTRALVSIIKSCGPYCGSGGIFEVEKAGSTWRRTATAPFTSDCSWMY